ncbi:sulfatase-like hydrolase/transferase [Aliiroseovarius crassostreae]|uniref:sulfatase-like hydrolase/transferase n=1 Tax=Aliiroseovarius crassostreae TaxID=154981 RepID=UPI003C7DA419
MASPSKKNLVLISFDDAVALWKYKTLFGQQLQTPNFDRICAQSTAFHNAYCQAPVCSPSRASFMSGLSPHQTGVTSSDSQYFNKISPSSMWPFRLKENGYFCSSGGKVMRGYVPLPDEVHQTLFSDAPKKFRLGPPKRNFKDRKIPGQIEYGGYRGGPATIDDKSDRELYDHQVADSALEFFETYDGDAPFYREVGFSGPHGPWTTPRRFKDMYPPWKFKKPAAWKNGFSDAAAIDEVGPKNIDSRHYRFWARSVRNYFSAVTHVDHQLGRVWDALKASRHADNTIVMIVSDHGLHLGERDRFRKHTLWEQVTNVPLVLHDPKQRKAKVIEDPVGLIDVGPTVMDYLDLPPIKDCVGRSLRPYAKGRKKDKNRAVPTFLFDNSAIRKGKYRYIRYQDGNTELFDLSEDWWQTQNLGPDHPDYDMMRKAHRECCLDYGLDVDALDKELESTPA